MRADYAWFALSRIEGLGPKRLHAIHHALTIMGKPIETVFRLDATEFQQVLPALAAFFPHIHSGPNEQDEREYEALRAEGITLVHLGHEAYPAVLRSRLGNSAPVLLYCKGDLSLLTRSGVAIVGARRASPVGIDFAAELAIELAAAGRDVISGYATGIDTAAHLGALRAGGTTTIVLSSGMREFAPKRDLTGLIREDTTLVVSQFPPATRWQARWAMARNKLICALAGAVVVVEAGEERDQQGRMSGTFDAGKSALAIGTPLFVLDPASFDIPSPGNVALIELGGTLMRRNDAFSALSSVAPSQEMPEQRQMTLPLL